MSASNFDINNSNINNMNYMNRPMGVGASSSRDVIEIDLLEVFQILLGRLWLIFLTGTLLALMAFGFSKFFITPTYQSTTKIYILNKQDSSNVTYSDVQMGTQLTKDYAELINSRYVIEEVIQKLGLDSAYKELVKKIKVTTPSDTRIVAITVEDTDPVAAMNIANAVREIAGSHIQNVMDIEAVNIVETANMPTEKASPSVSKWTIIGFLIGVLFVSAIEIIRYLLDDTIKSSEDVEKYLGLSTLALIPMGEGEFDGSSSTKKKKKKKK